MVPHEAFAGFYDRLTGGFWEHHVRTLDALVPEARAGRARALDLACGTGNGLGYLESRGYNAVGVDVSPEMLAIARRRWPGRTFALADMRALPTLPAFDVVVCCFDSINYLLLSDECQDLFRQVNRLLAAGGAFVFDTLRASDLRDTWRHHHRVIDEPGLLYAERCSFDEARGTGETMRTFFVVDAIGTWCRYDERHVQTAFEAEDIGEWLARAGFRDVVFRDGKSGEQIDPSSVRSVVVARTGSG